MVNIRNKINQVIKFSRAGDEKKSLINSAIRQQRPIEFYYMHGYRTVEPFAFECVLTDQQDNLSLLCWQTAGFSDLNETVGWKFYRVSDMEDVEIQAEHFSGIRPGYEPENLEMVQVLCCVPLIVKDEEPIPAPPAELKLPETSPIAPYVPLPPPPLPAQARRIPRVLSHNQLMERFRNAHPQPLPELEGLVWQEPLTVPFQESAVHDDPRPAVETNGKQIQTKIWPDTPVRSI